MTKAETVETITECYAAFMAWMRTDRPVDEIPGSDHERRIAWYAFREGWNAAKASAPTGDER